MGVPLEPLKIESQPIASGLMGNKTFHANLYDQEKQIHSRKLRKQAT